MNIFGLGIAILFLSAVLAMAIIIIGSAIETVLNLKKRSGKGDSN